MNSTSLSAYDKIKESLSFRRLAVLEVMEAEFRPMTNTEIANVLGWSINRVTGRVNELVEMNLVKLIRKGACPVTGFNASFWGWVKQEQQMEFEL